MDSEISKMDRWVDVIWRAGPVIPMLCLIAFVAFVVMMGRQCEENDRAWKKQQRARQAAAVTTQQWCEQRSCDSAFTEPFELQFGDRKICVCLEVPDR